MLWHVEGADKNDGTNVTRTVFALSKSKALLAANSQNVLVSQIKLAVVSKILLSILFCCLIGVGLKLTHSRGSIASASAPEDVSPEVFSVSLKCCLTINAAGNSGPAVYTAYVVADNRSNEIEPRLAEYCTVMDGKLNALDVKVRRYLETKQKIRDLTKESMDLVNDAARYVGTSLSTDYSNQAREKIAELKQMTTDNETLRKECDDMHYAIIAFYKQNQSDTLQILSKICTVSATSDANGLATLKCKSGPTTIYVMPTNSLAFWKRECAIDKNIQLYFAPTEKALASDYPPNY